MPRRRWRSTTFEPVEVFGQGGRQFDDPSLEGAAEQLELDLRTGRDVLVPGQHYDATRRNVTLELHVSSGTYVRSIAQALGGHCRTLRRTAVGPFRVEEADSERLLSVTKALARLPPDAVARVPLAVRDRVLTLEADGAVVP